ncbi:MAG: hypothetical protein V1929_02090 [bacterium]
MIITPTPRRVSLAGGGTDRHASCRPSGGFVVGSAVVLNVKGYPWN